MTSEKYNTANLPEEEKTIPKKIKIREITPIKTTPEEAKTTPEEEIKTSATLKQSEEESKKEAESIREEIGTAKTIHAKISDMPLSIEYDGSYSYLEEDENEEKSGKKISDSEMGTGITKNLKKGLASDKSAEDISAKIFKQNQADNAITKIPYSEASTDENYKNDIDTLNLLFGKLSIKTRKNLSEKQIERLEDPEIGFDKKIKMTLNYFDADKLKNPSDRVYIFNTISNRIYDMRGKDLTDAYNEAKYAPFALNDEEVRSLKENGYLYPEEPLSKEKVKEILELNKLAWKEKKELDKKLNKIDNKYESERRELYEYLDLEKDTDIRFETEAAEKAKPQIRLKK